MNAGNIHVFLEHILYKLAAWAHESFTIILFTLLSIDHIH